MRIFVAIAITGLCTVSSTAQDFTSQEGLSDFDKILAMKVPVFFTGPSSIRYETTDGSSQIGRIISELEPGWVLFSPCTGEAVKEQRDRLRETEVPCEAEPADPPAGIWSAKCSTTMPGILARVMVDASKGNAVGGEIYRSAGKDQMEVQQLDKFMNDWKTVDSVNCYDDQIFEIKYLSPEEATPIGLATGVDVGQGLMTLSPSDQ